MEKIQSLPKKSQVHGWLLLQKPESSSPSVFGCISDLSFSFWQRRSTTTRAVAGCHTTKDDCQPTSTRTKSRQQSGDEWHNNCFSSPHSAQSKVCTLRWQGLPFLLMRMERLHVDSETNKKLQMPLMNHIYSNI